MVIGAGYCGYRIYRHEQSQNQTIKSLTESIGELNVKLVTQSVDLDKEAKKFLSKCDDRHYNLLFIGNSITKHPLADYWWSDKRGMAATSVDKDYVHVTEKLISDKIPKLKKTAEKGLNADAIAFSYWESLQHDRAETYPLVDKYFTSGKYIDCIVLQLGENVSDADNADSTYELDYRELIEHLKKKAPNARIITVGCFWKNKTRDDVKKSVANEENVAYVDLTEIADNPEYEAGIGTLVDGDDGKKHRIEHDGVSKHPGDKGMEWIGEKVAEAIMKG